MSDHVNERIAPVIRKKLELPITLAETAQLIEMLKAVKHDSLWGTAIRKCFDTGGDVPGLISELADQCMDEPTTMFAIVGFEASILLLKTLPTYKTL